jgi:hypothetical protein
LDPAATLLGAVDDERLQRWYRTATVVMSLSTEESFGLTILEAAARGARLFVSDIPPHRDALAVIGGNDRHALVHPGLEPPELGRTLAALLDRGRLHVDGLRWRTWEDTVTALDHAYLATIDRQQRRA